MAKFHINPESGEPGECNAKPGNCPFAGEHYDSAEQARLAYEISMSPFSQKGALQRMSDEPLMEELKPWITEGPFGSFLNHPLVQDLMVDMAPGIANAQFRHKRERVERALAQQDWHSYIFLHERPYRFQALEEIIDDVPETEAGALVRQVWIDSENIHQNYDGWGEMLESHGMAMKSDEKKFLQGLPEKLTVYRGCSLDDDEGYSWTLDREKAKWFATRFSPENPQLLTATVDKSSVIAYLDSRDEKEIVLLPESIVRESLERELL